MGIGIQFEPSEERIIYLNELIDEKNTLQQSHVLMIYRYFDPKHDIQRVYTYHFTPEGLSESRYAIAKENQSGYWFMSFDEEYEPFQLENKN